MGFVQTSETRWVNMDHVSELIILENSRDTRVTLYFPFIRADGDQETTDVSGDYAKSIIAILRSRPLKSDTRNDTTARD